MKPGVVRQERLYPHPRARVWRTLTEKDLLGRWLMPTDFEERLGHRFTFRTDPGPGFDGIIHCEVLELEAPSRMVWSWRGGPLDTRVTFTLTEEDEGRSTRLVMVHDGFRGLRARIVGRILELGSRKLYGESLPGLLDELARGESPEGESHVACMEKEQGVLVKLLSLLERKKK